MERVVRAPGRVNLIGEHTDYNDGFVLPLAINLELRLRFRPRTDGRVLLRSREAPDEPLDLPAGGLLPAWGRYVEGVRALLDLPLGLEGEVASDIPAGAGLSSSAALELAVARALVAANGGAWEPRRIAQLAQRAEIEYAGNRCGIMDQLAVALGHAGKALLIDCRSLEARPVPLPAELAVVVCDSARPRQLVTSAYNQRRAACEEAACQLGVVALRDATPDMLAPLPAELRQRAEHVVAENQRVLDFVALLEDAGGVSRMRALDQGLSAGAAGQATRAGDTARLGQLMYASHASLRDLYEVSCPELDLLVELAAGLPGCIGSRLTGAGFGGCTVSLVAASEATAFADRLVDGYRQRTGLAGRAWVCRAVDGVSVESLT